MTAAGHMLQGQDLVFAYRPGQSVLEGVSARSHAGRLVCLLGPNGSGKTTLLRCLLGQLKPQSGSVNLDGRPLRKHSRRELARMLAYVPQFPQSSFAFSVRELVLMGRFAHTGVLGLVTEHDLAVARQAMIMTETVHLADRTLEELSGGEAQCVMIARALAQQPQVLLLDEPTSHLDLRNQLTIYRMMVRLAHDWPIAVVCVSHDINMAARFADELLLMRQGKVIADGPPSAVITADILEQVYHVKVRLLPSGGDVPLVVPE